MIDSSSLPFSSDIAQIALPYHANCELQYLTLIDVNELMQKKTSQSKIIIGYERNGV